MSWIFINRGKTGFNHQATFLIYINLMDRTVLIIRAFKLFLSVAIDIYCHHGRSPEYRGRLHAYQQLDNVKLQLTS